MNENPTEEALTTAEARLRMVLANAPMVLLAFDADERVIRIEGAAARFGLSWVRPGARLSEVFPGQSWLEEQIALGWKSGASSGTGRLEARDVEVHCSRVEGATHETEGVCLVLLDISDRLARERELKFRSALLECLGEASPDGLIVVSPDRDVFLANRRFREIWGVSEELVKRGADRELLAAGSRHLRDPAAFVERVEEIYGSPDEAAREEILLNDGRLIERYTAPLVDGASGFRFGRVWAFRDITERRMLLNEKMARRVAEAAARRSAILEETSRRLLGDLDDDALRGVARTALPYLGDACALYLLDADRRLRVIASDMSSGGAAVIGRAAFETGAAAAVVEVLRTGRASVAQAGDGAPEWPDRRDPELVRGFEGLHLRSYAALPITSGSEVLGCGIFASVASDHFDAGRLEVAAQLLSRLGVAIAGDRLHRATRAALFARDEFLSIASHELRTPVAGLRLALDGIDRVASKKTETPLPSKVERLLENAQDHVRNLATLIDRLLDVTRIRSGQLELELADVDLVAVARRVVESLRIQARAEGSELIVSGDASVVGCWDSSRVEQVVTNLLSNAIKYGAGRPIEVRVVRDGGLARLTVRDHGVGIAPDRIDRIFDRFERAAPAHSYRGLGLGLYIVQQIVSRLGGRVTVESELGVGSTFTVELELAGPHDEAARPPEVKR